MKIFLDTANLEEVKFCRDFIDGVTTNPSILSQYDSSEHKNIIKQICNLVKGHVSVEVTSDSSESMLCESRELISLHEKICIKLPCTRDGLITCKALSAKGIATNMTLCFSATQAILAARCGATYVSPFIGRLDDAGSDGISLIEDISAIYEANNFETEILAASVRSVHHVVQVATLGVDAITVSPKILKQCFEHPLTDAGLKIFARDWANRK